MRFITPMLAALLLLAGPIAASAQPQSGMQGMPGMQAAPETVEPGTYEAPSYKVNIPDGFIGQGQAGSVMAMQLPEGSDAGSMQEGMQAHAEQNPGSFPVSLTIMARPRMQEGEAVQSHSLDELRDMFEQQMKSAGANAPEKSDLQEVELVENAGHDWVRSAVVLEDKQQKLFSLSYASDIGEHRYLISYQGPPAKRGEIEKLAEDNFASFELK